MKSVKRGGGRERPREREREREREEAEEEEEEKKGRAEPRKMLSKNKTLCFCARSVERAHAGIKARLPEKHC